MLEAAAVALKASTYAAVLATAGIALASRSLRVDDAADPALARGIADLSRIAAAALAAAALGSAVVYALRLEAGWDPATLYAIFATPLGAALLLQFLGGGWVLIRRGPVAPAVALLMFLSIAATGHAAARGLAPAAVVFAHVVAAGWWVGGLCVLWIGGRHLSRDGFIALVERFGAQARIWVGALIAAGFAAAAVLLRFDPDLAQGYERTLILKIAGVSGLLAVAAVNRYRLTPMLRDDARAAPRMRTTIGIELWLVAGILAVTALLTTVVGLHDRRAPAPRVVATLSGLSIVDPWIAATPPGAFVAAGYVIFRNDDDTGDRLVSVSSPRAAHVAVHEVEVVGELMLMRELMDGLDLPARGEAALTPSARHLMFEDIDGAFVEGDAVEATLMFERRGPMEVLFLVRRLDRLGTNDHH